MSRLLQIAALAGCLGCPSLLLADFQYQETTQITGGSVMGLMKMAGTFSSQARKADQPVTSTVLVKGNRMARIRPESMEIIDLDRGTVTQIDTVKHQYTTMTFDQMKQQLERAQREAQSKQAAAPAKEENTAQQPSNLDMSYDVKVRNTGASREVSGLNTSEAIMTMSMIAQDKTTKEKGGLGITNDMWMAPEIPGFDEVNAFNQRFAQKMGKVFSGSDPSVFSALLSQPGAAKSLESMAAEMQKLKGTPVLQVMRMGSTADGSPLPAASEAPLPKSEGPAMPSVGDVAQQTATSALANKVGGLGGAAIGSLGGIGGFGRKKKAEPAPAPAPDPSTTSQQAQGAAASVLIESNTTMGGFSSEKIDPSRFEVPAGYKEVSPSAQEKSS
jgi:hypothetical protein